MKKILIADDEPDALRMLTLTVQVEGYEVITAGGGEEAIRQAVQERPDLIVLDVMMPGMDGYEVTRRLRRMPEFTTTPIIFLSARTQVEDKVEGLRAGGNDYVTKPASPEELMARIGAFLGTYVAPAGYLGTVFGSKSGVGTTTLAVNLALSLRLQTRAAVILVDGHNEGGDVGVFLNLLHAHHAGELMAVIDQLDQEIFKNVLVEHSSGLQVLLAPPDAALSSTITPSHWHRILSELRRVSSFVVFDGPPLRDSAWAPILDMADDIFLVTTPEITSMKRLGPAYALAQSRARKPEVVQVLLNRYTEQSGFSPSAIKRAMESPIHSRIDDIGPLNTFAINHGQPVVLADRRNHITQAITALAREIVGKHPVASPLERRSVLRPHP